MKSITGQIIDLGGLYRRLDGLCLLAIFLPGEGITLAQLAIESQQDEIAVAPTLLSYINLGNKGVIGDALHTQRQVSIQIGTAGGNYL